MGWSKFKIKNNLTEVIEEHISKFGKAIYIGREEDIPKEIKSKYSVKKKGNKHEIKRD